MFPRTLLRFHLLSHDELNDLAHFYEPDNPAYPCPTTSWEGSTVAEQRRSFAKFIGLKINDSEQLSDLAILLMQEIENYIYYQEPRPQLLQ